MIAKLRGLLDGFGADFAVIDVNGVGYLVSASSRTLSALGAIGEEVVLHTEMLVAEDSIRLVGFTTAAERDWFRLLTSVQGVGARVALAILSALSVDEVHRAVASGDNAMIAPPRASAPSSPSASSTSSRTAPAALRSAPAPRPRPREATPRTPSPPSPISASARAKRRRPWPRRRARSDPRRAWTSSSASPSRKRRDDSPPRHSRESGNPD